MEKIIELSNINFYYDKFQALSNINLDIHPGIHGLLGPNGSGKTTLMKVILGFLVPETGSGTVLGLDVSTHRKEVRRQIGYMPENNCLIPGMDGVALTSYMGELSGMPKQEAMKRAHEVLYHVGLEESRYRKAETYSSGMKQRLKLAIALVHDPKLLLLDEPTSGMDPKGRKEMLALIKDISQKKTMDIIISSHLLPDIENTCQQAIILNKGLIISQEAISIKTNDECPHYAIKLKGETQKFIEEIKKLGIETKENQADEYTISLPKGIKSPDLFKVAVKTKTQIRYYQIEQDTLEDEFVRTITDANGH